jgi:hypothetical protein
MISARDWVSGTIFDDYLVSLLQRELEEEPSGVCGNLVFPDEILTSTISWFWFDDDEPY